MAVEFEHPARLPVEELLTQCTVRFARRGGPGGQHRNKTESAVVLRHEPTGIEAQAAERRSQAENRTQAVRRLRLQLALDVRSSLDGCAAPSGLWKSRCRTGKIVCSEAHADFPSLLAEALDVLSERHGHLPSSAAQLECTVSQFVKLVSKAPAGVLRINEIRQRHGLPPRAG